MVARVAACEVGLASDASGASSQSDGAEPADGLQDCLLVHARRCQCSLPHAPPVRHLHVGRVRRRVTQPRKQRA